MLSSDSIVNLHCPTLQPCVSALADLLDDRLVLMLFLLFEKFVQASESSEWTSYIKILPDNARSPLNFDTAELEKVRGTQLYAAVQAKRRTLEKEFAAVTQRLLEVGEKLFGEHLNMENFVWADTMFRSRVFGIPAMADRVRGRHLSKWKRKVLKMGWLFLKYFFILAGKD